MNSNQKGPITPNQLLTALMGADFREIQCIDEAAKVRQQREILLQLILQYEQEIRKVHVLAVEEENLLQLREKLLVELELLRNQRAVIDAKIGEQIQTLRLAPIQDKQQQTWITDINQSVTRNNKLRIRIKDLMNYIEKLELQNRRLEEERRIVQVNEMQRRAVGEDWRTKIETLQKEHLSYEMQVKEKMRLREESTLREVQAQELQIKHRNERRRAQTLGGKRFVGTRLGQVIHSKYMRQI